nr:metallophosphoesterase [uncultured Pseudomonas sp.]
MKIQIYSDLHIEFADFLPAETEADLVILAGDIHTKTRGVIWANQTFACPVVYVAGNHEYYTGHLEQTLRKMRDVAAPNVHVLENDQFVFGNIRFLGTTSWTDYSSTGNVIPASRMAAEWMNDFKMVRVDASYRRLRPDDLIKRNHEARTWLTNELGKPFDGRTVVITHHAPTPHVVGDKHDGHLTASYANNWPELLDFVDLWVFGHTHRAVDVELSGCRVVSNPRGYPREQTGFDPSFMVEL